MNFSSALIVFTLILTPFYLVVILLSERAKRQERKTGASSVVQKALAVGLILMVILAMPLLFTFSFKATQFYFILLALITGALLFALCLLPSSRRSKVVTLFCAVLFHLGVFYSLSFGFMITERSSSVAILALEGSWNPGWGFLHIYYNLFPMDIGLLSMVSEVTSIGPINGLLGWIVGVLFTISFDLILYSLIKRISGSWRAGVFGVILLTFTPPTSINAQPQWIATFLLLISILALVRMFTGSPSIPNVIVANVSYVAAIFTHATATLGIFLILGVLAVSYFTSRPKKAEAEKLFKSPLLHTVLVTLILITLTWWIYSAGVMENLIDTIKAFTMELLGYHPEWIGAQYSSLYDQFVSPIHAYAWSTPVSMASALAVYYLIIQKTSRSTRNVLTLAMYICGSAFLMTGFVGGIFTAHIGFQRYLGSPGFIFLIPVAAIVAKKALESSKVLGVIIIALIVLQCGVAVTDPKISPQLYEEMKSVDPAGTEDYLEANFLSSVIPTDNQLVATYEVLVAFNYLEVVHGKAFSRYAGSLKVHRIMVDRLIEDKEALPGLVYIWSPEIRPLLANVSVDILYDSGRNIVLESGLD